MSHTKVNNAGDTIADVDRLYKKYDEMFALGELNARPPKADRSRHLTLLIDDTMFLLDRLKNGPRSEAILEALNVQLAEHILGYTQ